MTNATHTIITPSDIVAIYEVEQKVREGYTVSITNTPYKLGHTQHCIEMEFDVEKAKATIDLLKAAVERYEAENKPKSSPAERMAIARAARGKDK